MAQAAPTFNPSTDATADMRNKLKANGWHWLPGQGKGIYYDSWNKGEYDYVAAEYQASENLAWANTGILQDQTIARDIDAKIPSTAAKLAEATVLGDSPCGTRYGSKGSAKLYGVVSPMRSITVRGIAPGDTKKSTISEYIGKTRQLMCFGIHPDTSKPYRWDGKSPLDVSVAEFTKYSRDDFMAQAMKDKEIALADGWKDVTITVQGTDDDKAEAREGNGGLVDRAMLEKMLSHIDPGLSHDELLPVIGALRYAEACELVCDPDTLEPDSEFSMEATAIAWAQGNYWKDGAPGNYADGWAEKRWESMYPFKNGGAKFGTLVKLARDGGYEGAARIDSLLDRLPADSDSVIDQAEATLAKQKHSLREQVLAAAVPYTGQDPTKIKNMPWLYGKSAMRGEVGITLAASGVGKTALLLLMLHDMTTGTLNLERLHKGPLRAGFISFEDSKHILELRMEGIRKHYGGDADIWGDRLLLMSMLPFGFKLTARDETGVEVIDEKAFALLKEVILLNRLDYLSMDPWANMHGLPENDNGAAALLVARLKRLAIETNIFINIIHHVRKSIRGQDELNQEDSRGASALVSATRVKRILNPMSKPEASDRNIAETERWRYIRIMDGDSNHAARRPSEWFRKFGLDLGNAQDPATLAPGELPYEQDNVVVLERATFATGEQLISAVQVQAILDALEMAPARASDKTENELRFIEVIAEAMGLKLDDPAARQVIKAVRTKLMAGDVVAIERRTSPKSRNMVGYVVPGPQSCLKEHLTEFLPDEAPAGDDDNFEPHAGKPVTPVLH